MEARRAGKAGVPGCMPCSLEIASEKSTPTLGIDQDQLRRASVETWIKGQHGMGQFIVVSHVPRCHVLMPICSVDICRRHRE